MTVSTSRITSQKINCLFKGLFKVTAKKISRNGFIPSMVTDGLPKQTAKNAESGFISG